MLTILAMAGFVVGATASALRDETIELRIQRGATLTVPALSVLLLGRDSAAGLVAAGTVIVAAGLVERAGNVQNPPALVGQPGRLPDADAAPGGRRATTRCPRRRGIYAFTTLGGAIEAFREKP